MVSLLSCGKKMCTYAFDTKTFGCGCASQLLGRATRARSLAPWMRERRKPNVSPCICQPLDLRNSFTNQSNKLYLHLLLIPLLSCYSSGIKENCLIKIWFISKLSFSDSITKSDVYFQSPTRTSQLWNIIQCRNFLLRVGFLEWIGAPLSTFIVPLRMSTKLAN